ncbi:50S ribosomal protein L24 [Candidatus Pantoea edessiphila]|uniref:Large ribosomal subunit protein uL24 n=1 Tax=Candidatus Pantoea edessiphila TaxID=2044610 RepID=A0A2P5SXY8_9GAMM|nr:50S ribosomal protein L24 [Candidatus Pantoea edessiphila]MBK4775789.1 50S ribosomal protein L24 [Pantoea sp. Edef]PPI87185.1 50S ribosomal protein L24 [Candidatus Pantoea edessiphila]
MAAKIRRNDEVIVLTGREKGKRGKVKRILTSGKVIIDGINLVKKHQKPVSSLNKAGSIIEQESAMQISNIALFNVTTGKADRVGFRFQDGKKIRFFKSNNEVIK